MGWPRTDFCFEQRLDRFSESVEVVACEFGSASTSRGRLLPWLVVLGPRVGAGSSEVRFSNRTRANYMKM